MYYKMMHLIMCVLLIPRGKCMDVGSSQESFVQRTKTSFQELHQAFNIKECLYAAADLAEKVSGTRKGEFFFAVTWVNMYSRKCEIPEGLIQDPTLINFPFRLNKELRCQFHLVRDPRVRDVFVTAGNLINEALEQLSPVPYNKPAYRGLEHFPFASENHFIEEGFFSATLKVEVALEKFAHGKILMVIDSLQGVRNIYAEERYRNQEEVLGLKDSVFQIDRIEKDATTIKKEFPRSTPSQVIYVTQITVFNEGFVNNLKRQQHSLSLEYCTPKG